MPDFNDLGAIKTSRGGTGFISYAAGDLLYGLSNGPNGLGLLPIGAANALLCSDGSAPFWGPDWNNFTPTRTAATGTWTAGTITTARYLLLNKTLFWIIDIQASSNSAISATVNLAIPGGLVAAHETYMPLCLLNEGLGSPSVIGGAAVATSGTVIQLFREDGGNLSANTLTLYVRAQGFFEVN